MFQKPILPVIGVNRRAHRHTTGVLDSGALQIAHRKLVAHIPKEQGADVRRGCTVADYGDALCAFRRPIPEVPPRR